MTKPTSTCGRDRMITARKCCDYCLSTLFKIKTKTDFRGKFKYGFSSIHVGGLGSSVSVTNGRVLMFISPSDGFRVLTCKPVDYPKILELLREYNKDKGKQF